MIARSAARWSRRALVGACETTCAPFQLSPQSALVVAPHPDDEVFGAGGLIAAKRALGASVKVVYLTGGGASHRNCCQVSANQVIAHRQALSIRAAARLGLVQSDCLFLGLPDGSLPNRVQAGFSTAVSRLADIFASVSPDEIYCTHPMDVWPDHVAASAIARAAAYAAAPGALVFEYLVWAPLSLSSRALLSLPWKRATRLQIGPWAELKSASIQTYLSSAAPCGRPWVGELPPDFLRLFCRSSETFFPAADDGADRAGLSPF